MNIYRIARESGIKGMSNMKDHADVIANSGVEALRAAEAGKVQNWRWIDTWDTSQETHIKYTLLGEGEEKYARRPRK